METAAPYVHSLHDLYVSLREHRIQEAEELSLLLVLQDGASSESVIFRDGAFWLTVEQKESCIGHLVHEARLSIADLLRAREG